MKTHKVSKIQVESQGTVILPEFARDIQPRNNKPDVADAITIFEQRYKSAPKWVYPLAVVFGLIILAFVVFGLYIVIDNILSYLYIISHKKISLPFTIFFLFIFFLPFPKKNK